MDMGDAPYQENLDEEVERPGEVLNCRRDQCSGDADGCSTVDGTSNRVRKRTSTGTLKVEFGWRHYSTRKGKFFQVKGKGGGTWKADMERSASYQDCLLKAKELFFPNSESPYAGKLADMETPYLANFKLHKYNEEGFTVGRFKEESKMNLPRFYLVTKPKTKTDSKPQRNCPSSDTLYATEQLSVQQVPQELLVNFITVNNIESSSASETDSGLRDLLSDISLESDSTSMLQLLEDPNLSLGQIDSKATTNSSDHGFDETMDLSCCVVEEICPTSGSVKGGYRFNISFTEPLSEEVSSGMAEFGGIAIVPVHKLNPFTLSGFVPPTNQPGNVLVTVTTKSGQRLGMTFFQYVDVLLEMLQRVHDPAKQALLYAILCEEYGFFGTDTDLSQVLDPFNIECQDSSIETKQQQSVKVLQLLVYTAAQTNGKRFIEMISSTSAGRIVFDSYKDRTQLPEDVARANGHNECAQYLQDLTKRLSKETECEDQPKKINWLELVKAVQNETSVSSGNENKRPGSSVENDDNTSDYFADAETSSLGSMEPDDVCPSDSEEEDAANKGLKSAFGFSKPFSDDTSSNGRFHIGSASIHIPGFWPTTLNTDRCHKGPDKGPECYQDNSIISSGRRYSGRELFIGILLAGALLVLVAWFMVEGSQTEPLETVVHVRHGQNITAAFKVEEGRFLCLRWCMRTYNGVKRQWVPLVGMNDDGDMYMDVDSYKGFCISRDFGGLYIHEAQPCHAQKFMCRVVLWSGRNPLTSSVTLKPANENDMPRERFSPFGLFLLTTITGSSANLNIGVLGQSSKYQCYFNATVADSTNFMEGCLSVCTPDKRQKFHDLVCLRPGNIKGSRSCIRHGDPFLDDCCQKNVSQAYFHKHEDGSAEFGFVTKYGPISSCGNFTQSNITSFCTGTGFSSQDICTIMSTWKAGSSSANPLLTSTTAKTEGDVTGTVWVSSPSPGTTTRNHGSSANLDIIKLEQSFDDQCYLKEIVIEFNLGLLSFCRHDKIQKSLVILCLCPRKTKNSSGYIRHGDPILDDCCLKNIKEAYFHKHEDGSAEFGFVTKYGPIPSCVSFTQFNITSSFTGAGLSSLDICTITSTGTAGSSSANPLLTSTTAKTEGDVTGTVWVSSPSPGTTTRNHDLSMRQWEAGSKYLQNTKLFVDFTAEKCCRVNWDAGKSPKSKWKQLGL